MARVRSVFFPLVLALGACVYLEPSPPVVDRQFHDLQDSPKQFTEEVSLPLWHEEIADYVKMKEADGWWLYDQYPAGGDRPRHDVPDVIPPWWLADNFDRSKIVDIPNDPIKHKTILVFRRYGTKD